MTGELPAIPAADMVSRIDRWQKDYATKYEIATISRLQIRPETSQVLPGPVIGHQTQSAALQRIGRTKIGQIGPPVAKREKTAAPALR